MLYDSVVNDILVVVLLFCEFMKLQNTLQLIGVFVV